MALSSAAGVAEHVAAVEEQILAAAIRAGRARTDVLLVAASKTQPAEAIVEAAAAGVRAFGENRVQEGADKLPVAAQLLRERGLAIPEWHLLGHLQTNKAARAVELFDVIESVDSLRVAEALSRRAAKEETASPLAVFLEVYVGDDPARPGFRPPELEEQAEQIAAVPFLDIQGLMTVAPLGSTLDDARRAFAQVRELRGRLTTRVPALKLRHLSMGMSEDFEAAILEGATIVRIGRAIFGART